mgnify:CR=1 FL=1|jgi:hypothetical protein
MQFGVLLLTLGAYGLAIYLAWRDRTFNYLVALIAGNLLALLSPLWQSLYGFSYADGLPTLYMWLGRPLPRPIFWAAWTIMLPPLVIFYLYRHRWWISSYTTGLLTFALFVVYFLVIEMIGVRASWWCYSGRTELPFNLLPAATLQPTSCFGPTLSFGIPVIFLAALMNGLIALGSLSALLLTHHYSLSSLLFILLPIPLLLGLFVHGLLGAPLYAALLLQAQASWAGALGLLGTLGLLAWGAHIVAGSLTQRNDWHAI